MLLLCALMSLLVAGSRVLPGVLLAASGIAVVVRQRMRMQEGKAQQRRAIQAGINKSIAVSDQDASCLVKWDRAGGGICQPWAVLCFPTQLSPAIQLHLSCRLIHVPVIWRSSVPQDLNIYSSEDEEPEETNQDEPAPADVR